MPSPASPVSSVCFVLQLFFRRYLVLSVVAIALQTIFATGAPVTGAEDSNPRDLFTNEFVVSTWYGEGGLPHNRVNSVVRDPHGFLWLGTLGGLARFDGRNFVEYPMPHEFSYGRNEIRALAVEDSKTMVMITGGGRIVRLRNGKFEPHPIDKLIKTDLSMDMVVDEMGALWIASVATGKPVDLMRWDGQHLLVFGEESGMGRRSSRFCIIPDGKNRTWLASGEFIGWYDASGFHRLAKTQDQSIMAAKSHTGGIWIASRERLAKFDGGNWQTVMDGADWPAAEAGIQDIYETVDGTLWVATRQLGLFRLTNGRLQAVPLRYGRVESIAEDIDNNIWLGTNGGGLVRLKPRHHVLLNTTTGLPKEVSSSMTEDETGALWLANQAGGVVRIKNGNPVSIPIHIKGSFFASNICADQKGNVWCGAISGLYHTTVHPGDDGWKLQRYDTSVTSVQTLFCAQNGDLWFSWKNGQLGLLQNNIVREFTTSDGWPGERVAGVVERKGTGDPEIWVASQFGRLFKLSKKGDRFEECPLPDKVKTAQIYAIHVDNNNRLWLGTSIGLLLWDEQDPVFFTRANGFPDDIIYQVITDNHNRLWLSGRRGIFCVDATKLLTSRSLSAPLPEITFFGRNENLEGLSGMVGGQPMTWKGKDGRLWFATYRGVIGFDDIDPALIPNTKHPVYVDGVSANETNLDIQSAGEKEPVRIEPNPMQVKFSFVTLNFSASERIRVRRMLDGFDAGWVDATDERSCVYSRLPPGEYTFRVESIDIGSNTPKYQSSLAIKIAAAWWQTSWFRFAVTIVIISMIAWIARLVSNRILKQRLRRLEYDKKLDQERTRIARDLHDELGSRMSRIGFAADSIIEEKDPGRQKSMLTGLITHSRGLVEDLHRIVWTVNPQNDSWHELAEYISRYTHRMLTDTQITGTVDGIDNIPDIPVAPDVRHHIVAITKEAINNMLKHSCASHLAIQMNASNEHFHMSISDNGQGFDKAAVMDHDGYGLENMRKRMDEVGGRCTIDSKLGNGTSITLDISLKYRTPHAPRDGA